MKIGLLSDTHSYLDPTIFEHFAEVDEIWHAGDIGDPAVMDQLESFKPCRVVWGNIDEPVLRQRYSIDEVFEIEGLKIFMTHIGGYPGRYHARARKLIDEYKPNVFICGHSHILKVMPDQKRQLLHINPGACGRHGFHRMRTIIRFTIEKGKIKDLEVVELGLRGKVEKS